MTELTPEHLAALPDWLQEEAARHVERTDAKTRPELWNAPDGYHHCRKDYSGWPCPEVGQFIRLADALLALEFYGERENWRYLVRKETDAEGFSIFTDPPPTHRDAGKRARAALAGLRPA